jgi:hypothetical protein
MVERLVLAIALALVAWLERRWEKSQAAKEADADHDRLRRAGDRVREWLRNTDRVGP